MKDGTSLEADLVVEGVGLDGRRVLALVLHLLDLRFLRLELVVDANVELKEVVNGIRGQRRLVAVSLVRQRQQAVLLAPVSEVVDPHHVPAGRVVEVCDEAADDCAAQVASVKRFGDVGRAKLDNDALLAL